MGEQFIPISDIKTLDSNKNEVFKQSEVIPPPNTFFIRGIRNWTPGSDMSSNFEQISISLHKDNKTVPIRQYGYIIKIDSGGIIKAYDRDVSTEATIQGDKFIPDRVKKTTREYTEKELESLIENTSQGKHNEIIVYGNKVEIVGAYVIEGTHGIPGIKKFKHHCREANLHIHQIPILKKTE